MFRPRIIPVLLLHKKGLVKSVKFRNYRYIGDPINAVKIFNDLFADELVFLDIVARKEKRVISPELVKNIGEEANMPFSVGGGINSLEEIHSLLSAGAEKVILGSISAQNPDFIKKAAENFGSSTITVCIDVKKNLFGKDFVYYLNATQNSGCKPIDFAQEMESCGAGELIIQSVDNDGTMRGYDIDLIYSVSQKVTIPVVALGGAGSLLHLKTAYQKGYATALAAGSIFVYHGSRNGILINYPDQTTIKGLFNQI
jgi:imidazole glycerol-phosphate synthase subunit HisF